MENRLLSKLLMENQRLSTIQTFIVLNLLQIDMNKESTFVMVLIFTTLLKETRLSSMRGFLNKFLKTSL
jgi:hypothetical protein